jgi:hypothetical protein
MQNPNERQNKVTYVPWGIDLSYVTVDAENQHTESPMTICFTFVEVPRLVFEQTSKGIISITAKNRLLGYSDSLERAACNRCEKYIDEENK